MVYSISSAIRGGQVNVGDGGDRSTTSQVRY